MTAVTMTIDGKPSRSLDDFQVINPATDEVVGLAPAGTYEQVEAAAASAQRAFGAWSANAELRRTTLDASADRIQGATVELATMLTAEQGKPASEATGEVTATAALLRYYANLDLPDTVLQDDHRGYVKVYQRAIGPVLALAPWNFPLSQAALKIGPALAAGNTAILKPSPYTPLTTLRIGELLRDTLPPGVLNVISGDNQVGAWLSGHPTIRKISLTGSVATGKLVAKTAADDLKRTTLELGGNDAAILLADVDPRQVAKKLFWRALTNCGQVCIAIKRLYVPTALHDAVVEALADYARRVCVGDGRDPATQLGPLTNSRQRAHVADLVTNAVGQGGVIASGGRPRPGPGNFYEPTIIGNARRGMAIVDEEQFGPALPVVAYESVEEAIEQANATNFGLGGSVWSNDLERAAEVAAQLQCGTVWVNTHMASTREQPFGGWKWSGLGLENGPAGLLDYTATQVVHISRR